MGKIAYVIELHIWSRAANDGHSQIMHDAADLAVWDHLEANPTATIEALEDVARGAIVNCEGIPESVLSSTGVNISFA